jgi:putative beta-N-acetylhexosaminidase
MNQFTIEFKNAKDLAKKISEYNELMNPQSIEELAVNVKPIEQPKTEPVVEEKSEPKVEKPVPGAKVDKEIVKNISIEIEEPPVPVTDFDGNVVDVEPIELAIEDVKEEIDYQTYWAEFKDWLKAVGQDGIKAALTIFRNHGVQGNPSSENLTPEIIEELNALMNK